MKDKKSHNGTPEPASREPDRSALEVRSAEVQEIIGRPPHWLVRGGIGAFLGVLLLVFAAASTIEYPEVVEGELILQYEPTGGWYGRVTIPESGLGNIEEGQAALVHFTGYSSQRYGSVEATIEYGADVRIEEGRITLQAKFPEGFITNYGHELNPIEGMTGRAEIITKDQKLLDRIYNNIAGKL